MPSKLKSLFSRVKSSPAIRLGRGLLDSCFTPEKTHLALLSILSLSIVALGSIFYFVYADHLHLRWQQQRHADLACLARNIYHEARGEPIAGQHAVAEVTLNRVASRRFPGTVCEVVYEKRFDSRRNRLVGAFSWTELDSVSKPSGTGWKRAMRAAKSVYDRQQEPTVERALFYHADRIEPNWASEKRQVAQIGRHIFYE
jgi:spore germination cell wall hydrolase CwlJ-like protein